MQGIWEVEYRDGRILNQYDKTAPEFNVVEGDPIGGEVPFRKIDWDQVVKLNLYNMEGVGQSFDVQKPEGFDLSLRSRSFVGLSGEVWSCFILLVTEEGRSVNKGTVRKAYYWFPDFTEHHCTEFDCSTVREYALGKLHGVLHSLPHAHESLEVNVDAVLVP